MGRSHPSGRSFTDTSAGHAALIYYAVYAQADLGLVYKDCCDQEANNSLTEAIVR
jgi:hypothetical protein